MPFTVGQYLTANDLKSQEDAHTLGYGVVNGLKVIPEAPPSMDIEVEIGKAYAANTLVVKGAVTTLTVGGADGTNPRKDIVVCDSAGTLSIVAGTPEAALPVGNIGVYTLNPEPPSIPANSIILAEIWVAAGAASITGAEIYDKRVSIADFLTHKDAATGVHGVGASTVCSETEADEKITAHGTGAKHRWTLNKLLKGAGAGADPTEIDVPATITIVRKTADETVDTAILQNDDHLLLALAANEIWLVEFILMATNPYNRNIDLGFSYPTNCSISWGTQEQTWADVSDSSGAVLAVLTETDMETCGVKQDFIVGIKITAIVVNGANAGNLNLQWAGRDDMTVKANSCLIAFKLA